MPLATPENEAEHAFSVHFHGISWCSHMFSIVSGQVKGILTDRQKQKLQLLDNLDDLKKDFAYHQLEEDLGPEA